MGVPTPGKSRPRRRRPLMLILWSIAIALSCVIVVGVLWQQF
jgi:hypothetical protein